MTNHRDKPQQNGDEPPSFAPTQRAAALIEALPYIQKFRNAVVVVKYGGHAMVDPALATTFAQDVMLLRSVGIQIVVVHGGGPQIAEQLHKLGKTSEFVDGLRVTDAETLDVVRMVLVGKVGRDIVGAINVHGGVAVGVSGEDGGLINATQASEELGFVGQIASVQPAILEQLLAQQMIPVVSTIGTDLTGQSYNINADAVAGAVAVALRAKKVVYLTDVVGLFNKPDDDTSIMHRVTVEQLTEMINEGSISGGMIPKAKACIDSVSAGVASAHLLDGRMPHVLLLELFTDAGIGTMVTL